ncbi:MAG: hypothetical protein ACYC6W_08535 [Nitrosotalea sp.]
MKTRNKISLVLGGIVVVFAAYVSLTVNFVMGASLLVALPFLLCLIPCGGAVGVSAIMWLTHRSKMNNNLKKSSKRKLNGCLLDSESR